MEKAEEQKTEPKVWHIRNGVRGLNFNDLPRCTAISASTGKSCGNVQMRGQNGLCAVHSGHYRPGAPKGNQRALKSGFFTKKALLERRLYEKS